MKELQKNGLRVSQGVSTVGFDNIPLAQLPHFQKEIEVV